jgi:hypothetical protein
MSTLDRCAVCGEEIEPQQAPNGTWEWWHVLPDAFLWRCGIERHRPVKAMDA